MRFHVPQFIEVEDKIFGPLTFKQFIYLLGGGAIIFVLYAFLPLWLVIILGVPVAVFVAALAFLKIYNQPFIKVLQNTLRYTSANKLYLWKKRERPQPREQEIMTGGEKGLVSPPALTKRRLKDLAWSLDIKEKTKE
jgi:hypothetical protein